MGSLKLILSISYLIGRNEGGSYAVPATIREIRKLLHTNLTSYILVMLELRNYEANHGFMEPQALREST